jgi:hypothetical protein
MLNNNEKKILPTSFRIPRELLKEFRVACAQREVVQSEVVTSLIEGWTDHPVAAAPIAARPPTKWHQMLTDILESGDREAISAVQQNLLVFHRIAIPGAGVLAKRRTIGER